MQEIRPADLANAERVLESVLNDWLLRPGVTAVDLGYKWSHGEMTDQLAIRVHVARKKAASEMDPAELFPDELEGVPVDILEASYGLPPAPEFSNHKPAILPATKGDVDSTHIPIGVSISNPYTTAGTLGAKVIDLDSGRELLLSNWHVLAGQADIDVGTPIWHPGRADGGTARNGVGALARWVIGPYDAAVARLNHAVQLSTQTPDGLSIEATTVPLPGMIVWKYGRTSGYTEGYIDGTRGTVPLNYPQLGTTILLQDVMRILPMPGHQGEISLPGDSGSVWVEKSSGYAVGLHCAGETGLSPEFALAHDIGPVMRTLFIRFPGDGKGVAGGDGDAQPDEPPAGPPPLGVDGSLGPNTLLSLLRQFLFRLLGW